MSKQPTSKAGEKKRQYEQGVKHERKRIVDVVTNMPSDWESRTSIQEVLHIITNNHEDHKE